MGDRRFDYSRASLYRLAWILWAASLVCPSSGGSVNSGRYYPTAFYMLAYVIRPEAMPAFHRGFDPCRVAIFTLGLFSNSAFLFTPSSPSRTSRPFPVRDPKGLMRLLYGYPECQASVQPGIVATAGTCIRDRLDPGEVQPNGHVNVRPPARSHGFRTPAVLP